MYNKSDENSVVFYAYGMNDQVIIMDFDNKMVVVRNGLYKPILNQSDQSIMNVSIESGIALSSETVDITKINVQKIQGISLPISLPLIAKSKFDFREFYQKVKQAID
jgi:hypothetical protein